MIHPVPSLLLRNSFPRFPRSFERRPWVGSRSRIALALFECHAASVFRASASASALPLCPLSQTLGHGPVGGDGQGRSLPFSLSSPCGPAEMTLAGLQPLGGSITNPLLLIYYYPISFGVH